MPNFDYEKAQLSSNKIISGVDEVGRGSLAGPIVAAAVVFGNYDKIILKLRGIDDSKKLTEKKRNEYDIIVKKYASDFAFGVVTADEIDFIGIGAANVIAFKRALDSLQGVDMALIDGRKFRGFPYKYICLEKGESKSFSIAAASIIAKVYRDYLMTELSQELPQYDFANNKGYGSEKHLIALKKHGISIYHRRSFLKSYFDSQGQLF